MHLFSFRKFYGDLFLLFFLFCFLYCSLGMVREKRGGRGGQGLDAWSIKFDNVHIQLKIIIKLLVNPNITFFLSIQGFRSPSKASSHIKPSAKHVGFMRF